jgi:hypothetical protein
MITEKYGMVLLVNGPSVQSVRRNERQRSNFVMLVATEMCWSMIDPVGYNTTIA